MTNRPRSTPTLLVLLLAVLGAIGVYSDRASARQDNVTAANAPIWPRSFVKDDVTIVLQQPQVDRWDDFTTIAFRSAVEVIKAGGQPRLGVISVTARTDVDKSDRLVLLTQPQVGVSFPGVPAPEAENLVGLVRDLMPGRSSLAVSLDRVLALSDMDESLIRTREVEVNLEPPPIFYSAEPAKLLVLLGPPRLQAIDGTALQFATNTNWDVIYHPASKTYYVLDGTSWVSAPDVIRGPFTPVAALPEEFGSIPDDENWSDVRAAIPARPAQEPARIFASAKPAELIVTDGPPTYTPIEGTSLQQVVNTDAPLIFEPGSGKYYFLVAGRWFSTAQLGGSWTAATFNLPEDFRNIPPDGDLGDLRASVAGTDEAAAAAVLAAAPTKTTVNRGEVTVNVTYDGEPKLVEIEGADDVQYVPNTAYDVFVVDGEYYCCHNGIWFIGATPNGPWTVCDTVPASIYTIPPSSPMHNVTYVTVYEATPETVTVGATSGYAGELLVGGLVVFGAALAIDEILDDDDWSYYRCHAGFYSYGCGAVYHHGSGGYYRAATRYGPYGGARAGAVYNPGTGGWARGAARYGPRGAAAVREGYNPWTDTYGARAGAVTPYGARSRGVAVRDDEWVRGGQAHGIRGSAGWMESSEGGAVVHADRRRGGQGTVARDDEGNVYVGKDGNVYRRGDDGQWESRQGGDWNRPDHSNVERPSTARDVQSDLDRHARTRDTANRRVRTAERERARPTRGGGAGRDRGNRGGGGRRRP